jgi:multiple sugar transport system substrate-binding protein
MDALFLLIYQTSSIILSSKIFSQFFKIIIKPNKLCLNIKGVNMKHSKTVLLYGAIFLLVSIFCSTALGKTQIRVLLEDTPWHRNIEKSISDFESMSGYEISLEFMPEVQSREKIDLDLTAGTGLYDVFLTDEMYIQKFAKLGRLEPLDKYTANDNLFDIKDFSKLALQTHTHLGKLYAIPWRTGTNVLAYRKDILEKYDIKVPKTFDELMDAAIKARQGLLKDGKKDVYGLIARGIRGEGLNIWIIGSSLFPAWGGEWFDKTGKPTINSPEMVAALDYYTKILQKTGPKDSAALSWDDCSRLYNSGKGVFFIDSAVLIALLYDQGGFVAENTGVALVPSGPNGPHPGLYTPGYVMSKNAKNKKASWEFIRWATSYKQMLSDAVDGGNYEIASEKAIKSPKFNKRFPYAQLNSVVLENRKYSKEERPMILRWPEVGDIVGEVAQRAIAGEISAKQALDEAQERVMEIYREDPEGLK